MWKEAQRQEVTCPDSHIKSPKKYLLRTDCVPLWYFEPTRGLPPDLENSSARPLLFPHSSLSFRGNGTGLPL